MKIRTRIWWLWLAISTLLVAFFLIGLQQMHRLSREIKEGTQKELEAHLQSLIATERQAIMTYLYTETWSDDMAAYMHHQDLAFADKTVKQRLDIHGLDAGYIFTPEFELIYSASAEGKKLNTLLSPHVEDIKAAFDSSSFVHYFMKTPQGTFEIFGASIHPFNDKERISNPSGYLVVARAWDSAFMAKLSELSKSKVALICSCRQGTAAPSSADHCHFHIALPDALGHTASPLHVCQNLEYLQKHQAIIRKYLAVFAGRYLFLIIALFASLYVWVLRPLKRVSIALREDSTEPIKQLTHITELGEMEKEITLRLRQAEELEEAKKELEAAEQAKSQFLRNLSHEFNTPLNGVFGAAQLLKSTDPNEEQQEYLDIINDCANHLELLISELLSLTRLESGAFVIEEEPFDLHELITSVCLSYKKAANAAGLNFSCCCPQQAIPEVVIGDQTCIRKILHLLLTNALKFTHKGEITIETRLVSNSAEQVLIRISVSDTGIGIPEGQLDDLMNMFTQADSSDTRKYEGLGIGLALARGLTLKINGSISASSEEGKGSTFTVELPLQKVRT